MILKYIHSIYDTKHTSNPICLLSYFKIFRGGGGGGKWKENYYVLSTLNQYMYTLF